MALTALAACTAASNGPGGPTGGATSTAPGNTVSATSGASSPASSPAGSASADPTPVAIRATAATTSLNPVRPITVDAVDGSLRSVRLVNTDGKVVEGTLSDDRRSWHTAEVLGYSKSYTLVVKAVPGTGSTGEQSPSTLRRSYQTVTPNNMTMPYLDTVYGSSIEDGATYGVGMIPVVHFDEEIQDRAAAQRALTVTTTPHVDGSWYWSDGHSVHWRPRHYYAPGTKVTVAATVYGVDVGGGMYGQADQSVSYSIGDKHVAVADAKTHRVKVYFSNTLVRNMPTSMGRGGTVPGKNGQTIYLWTMPGTYTVIGHENPATMSSDSYGLPANSPLGYAPEKVPFATKISTDGIYLHELDTTVGYQGNSNVSHGCLNLNYTNSSWYFRTSRVGDIVKVVNSGGPKLQLWQGGDWSLSWAEIKNLSAV